MKIDDLYGKSHWLFVSPLFLLGISVIFFIAGWIFPVQGPIDYVYDEHVGQKTIKKPVVAAPMPKPEKQILLDGADVEDIKEVLIDLNEDGEQEWYLFMPLLKGQ